MSRERFTTRLSGGDFKREKLAELERAEVLREFGDLGLVEEVLGRIGDGKEATVYACRADASAGVPFAAAKVYRAQKFRAFSGARGYAGERAVMASREKRAMRKGTKVGRRLAHHEWIGWEYATLERLFAAGADVPRPLARSEDAILMELATDGDEPAPQLQHVELERDAARLLLDRLLASVEILLDCHLVHGDLSAYNVLYGEGRPWIIDVPQSIDLHHRPDGYSYLDRDVHNLERYFARYGLTTGDFAHRAWRRYLRGELG
jgi:RIO kinase 1